jgi:transmembrane sensor
VLIAEASAFLLARDRSLDRDAINREIDRWRALSPHHDAVWAAAGRVWLATGGDTAPVSAVRAPAAARRRFNAPMTMSLMAVLIGILAYPVVNSLMDDSLRSAVGETRHVTLSDGSSVVMDAGSAVTPATGPVRGATLNGGKAFFAVAHDRTKPFHVLADAVDVEVTGTAFSVSRSRLGVDIELAEGSVLVHVGSRSERMKPGERLRIDRGGAVHRDAVSPAAIGAWRYGELAVEDATVQEVVEALRPHFRGVILNPPAALAGQRVTGVFRLDDPEAALDAALTPFGAKAEAVSPWVLRLSTKK